jgi:hypothetical protein
MAVFISLTTDSFADTFNAATSAKNLAQRAGVDRARRPLRGLEIKDDTYAIIKVIQADGTPIKLIDSGSADGTTAEYSNFILQSVQETRMEKHQIVETFGEPYIFFFGEAPRFLDVTAVLVDSLDFNWYAEFWQNYNLYLRGTKSVEAGARTYLFYDDNIVEGYMLQAQARKTSETPMMVQLQFRLYLTNYSNVTLVGDPNYPIRSSVNLPPSVDLTTADAFTAGQAGVTAANQAALNDAAANQATLGAQQQAGGFGGGQSLSDALRQGVTSTGSPYTDGVLANALEALGNVGSRTMPLRGKIADNVDEFTALVPSPAPQNPPSSMQDQEGDQSGQPDATDLSSSAVQQAQMYGADINDPDTFSRLGLGPRFTSSAGIAFGASAGFSASFGVRGGSSFGSSYGGVNGGLGFTGSFTASVSASAPASTTQTSANASVGFNQGVFGNGVAIQQGISSGTGIGGGIPGGMSGGLGPDGTPGGLTQFQGGSAFSQTNGFGSQQGYGQGLSANGASVSVGGAPSAFSMVVAPGTLDPSGSVQESFFIGAGGASSTTNTSGIFV